MEGWVKSPNYTTALGTMSNCEPVLTRMHRYPVVGRVVPLRDVKAIERKCRGLMVYWNCIEKARVAWRHLRVGRVVVGSLMVRSGNNTSAYGHHFNPPFELHAWLDLDGGNILDMGLPGVIAKGLKLRDKDGPILIKRRAIILNGQPIDWLHYEEAEEIGGEDAAV